MIHLLGDEMKNLGPINDFPRQFNTIGNHHRFVIGIGLTGGETIARVRGLRQKPGRKQSGGDCGRNVSV